MEKKVGGRFLYTGNAARIKAKNDLVAEILETMIRSPRIFKVIGGTKEETTLNNLKLHVDTRIRIVKNAVIVGKWKFGKADFNEKYWSSPFVVKPGVNPSNAFSDFFQNPQEYTSGCFTATFAVLVGSLPNLETANDQKAFNDLYNSNKPSRGPASKLAEAFVAGVPATAGATGQTSKLQNYLQGKVQYTKIRNDNWIPGDWGYIQNGKLVNGMQTEHNVIPPKSSAFLGENIIYLGHGSYWGFFGNKTIVQALNAWVDEVKSWAIKKDQVYILEQRIWPFIGLE